MTLYWLALGALSVWRLTHLFHAEDGPAELLARLRRLAGSGFWGSLLDCFYCLSLWIAAPFAVILGAAWRERVLLWLALSGAACLLERATGHNDTPAAPAPYFEYPKENDDVVLRKSEGTIPDGGASAERSGRDRTARLARPEDPNGIRPI
jgi:hypothetical protein